MVLEKKVEEKKSSSPFKKCRDDSLLFPEERFGSHIEVKSPR